MNKKTISLLAIALLAITLVGGQVFAAGGIMGPPENPMVKAEFVSDTTTQDEVNAQDTNSQDTNSQEAATNSQNTKTPQPPDITQNPQWEQMYNQMMGPNGYMNQMMGPEGWEYMNQMMGGMMGGFYGQGNNQGNSQGSFQNFGPMMGQLR